MAGIKNIVWNIHHTKLDLNSTKLRNLIIIKFLAILSYFIPRSIVVVSKSGIKNCKKLGYCRKKLYFIPNGYELNVFKYNKLYEKKFKKKFRIKTKTPLIGTVSRFDPIKDPSTLLNALAIVRQKKKGFFIYIRWL